MEENKFKNYLSMICSIVNRNYNFSVAINSIEFYGIRKYSEENVYKITMTCGKKSLIFYIEEPAFEHWDEVPWSGQRSFRPADWDNWPEDKKLIVAWCWCIYKYCTVYSHQNYEEDPPEILE